MKACEDVRLITRIQTLQLDCWFFEQSPAPQHFHRIGIDVVYFSVVSYHFLLQLQQGVFIQLRFLLFHDFDDIDVCFEHESNAVKSLLRLQLRELLFNFEYEPSLLCICSQLILESAVLWVGISNFVLATFYIFACPLVPAFPVVILLVFVIRFTAVLFFGKFIFILVLPWMVWWISILGQFVRFDMHFWIIHLVLRCNQALRRRWAATTSSKSGSAARLPSPFSKSLSTARFWARVVENIWDVVGTFGTCSDFLRHYVQIDHRKIWLIKLLAL